MLGHEVIASCAGEQIGWLGPLNADSSLRGVREAVSDQELEDHPLAYRPSNQPQDEPLRYHGVLRSATIEYEGDRVPIQVLVVKSRTKVKLDRDRRQTYLDRLIGRLEEIQGIVHLFPLEDIQIPYIGGEDFKLVMMGLPETRTEKAFSTCPFGPLVSTQSGIVTDILSSKWP